MIEGANRHDKKLLAATLDSIPIKLEQGLEGLETIWNLCLDAGYDYQDLPPMLQSKGYIPHIRSRKEEQQQKNLNPDYRPRRWVVERTTSWINRFRRLLIRWEKKADNYLALLHLAFALICFKATGLLG